MTFQISDGIIKEKGDACLEEITMNREIKDSVFSRIFQEPEYQVELYTALHPEDKNISQESIELVTLKSILMNGMYNDLGLMIRDLLIFLMEAQSTFSWNIALRVFMYLATTYKEYVSKHKLDIYATKSIQIPRPELYVLYTGGKKVVPDVIKLSDLFIGGITGDAELYVKVLRYRGTNDIIDQYVRFCNIADEQRKLYGFTQKAAHETIRICISNGILVSFLRSREKEVIQIMDMLFSQEEITRLHEVNLVRDAEEKGLIKGRTEGRTEGRMEGQEEGRENTIPALIRELRAQGMDKAQITAFVKRMYSFTPAIATEKVQKYWLTN